MLQLDRVAPLRPSDGLDVGEDTTWEDGIARRRRHAQRLIAHVETAVAEVAAGRERVERGRAERLWLDRFPPRVLATYIEAGRDLARVLERAEAYLSGLSTPEGVARILIANLPEPTRRDFGPGVVVRLNVLDTDVDVGLTMAGERVPRRHEAELAEDEPPQIVARAPRAGQPSVVSRRGPRAASFDEQMYAAAPVLGCTARELIGWLRGELSLADMLDRIPSGGRPRAKTALTHVHRRLDGSAIPRPPPWVGR